VGLSGGRGRGSSAGEVGNEWEKLVGRLQGRGCVAFLFFQSLSLPFFALTSPLVEQASPARKQTRFALSILPLFTSSVKTASIRYLVLPEMDTCVEGLSMATQTRRSRRKRW
jgi:hypothetical protein